MKALHNSQPVRRCEHVSATGIVCHRPVMRGNSDCYIHHEVLAFQPWNIDWKPELEASAIENPALIRAAINRALTARNEGRIPERHASLYVHALHTAHQIAKQRRRARNRRTEKRGRTCVRPK